MGKVVADTSPLRYLVQIGQIELLPVMFDTIVIPAIVARELLHPSAPPAVRSWMGSRPHWLEVANVAPTGDPSLAALDNGESSAIALGLLIRAGLILMDDRRGAAVARWKGLEVTGTLGVLDLGARRGLCDLAEALARLRATNFRSRPSFFDALLKQHESR